MPYLRGRLVTPRASDVRIALAWRVSDAPEYSWGYVFHQEHEPHLPRPCTEAALAALAGVARLYADGPDAPGSPAIALLQLARGADCPEVHDMLFNFYRDASNDGAEPQHTLAYVDILALTGMLVESARIYARQLPTRARRALEREFVRISGQRIADLERARLLPAR